MSQASTQQLTINRARARLEDLYFGERPHEPFHGLQNFSDVTGTARYSREPQLGPLPLVLIPNFGRGNLIPPAGAFENGFDESPLFLQGMAGGQEESDVKVPYVRGISRSS